MMDKLFSEKLNRDAWGLILGLGAIFATFGALVLESVGLRSQSMGPVTFISALVCVQLGLFAMWPTIAAKGRELLKLPASPRPRPGSARSVDGRRRRRSPPRLALWSESDPRLSPALFAANVPTFVLDVEQRFVDWNGAFALAFGQLPEVRRGAPVSRWFERLDNFRRIPRRTEQLYGEAILPIADRERVTFLSERWGRMVFTKIMNPIIDRKSGRIIGWTVVLNINSVNKRQEYFEQLYAEIALETKKARFASSYDGLFDTFPGRRELVEAHVESLAKARRVLELGPGTGTLARRLLEGPRVVTAVESDLHLLRRLKDKLGRFDGRARIVRREALDQLEGLPEGRFDGAAMMLSLHRLDDPAAALGHLHRALKPGGLLSLSALMPPEGVETLYAAVRAHLERGGLYDNLKHQLGHVLELEREQAAKKSSHFPSRDELLALTEAAGFTLVHERRGLQQGTTLLLVLRK